MYRPAQSPVSYQCYESDKKTKVNLLKERRMYLPENQSMADLERNHEQKRNQEIYLTPQIPYTSLHDYM